MRSFRLPGDADGERVEAYHRDGLLTIRVPKRAPAPSGGKKIEVRTG